MKELKEILSALEALRGEAVLATVVDVKGSSYRLPGAKMLVLEDGDFVGTVSGGCVEADVLERAKRVLSSGSSELFLYDTTKNDNSVFSLNMGCKGIVRVLLEPLSNDSEYARFLRGRSGTGTGGFAVLKVPREKELVSRCYFDSEGRILEGDVPDEVTAVVRSFAERSGKAQRPARVVGPLDNGDEYFVEHIGPPRELLILGAGADAIPLTALAGMIGWRVKVVDHRPAFATEERFPGAEVVVCRPEKLTQEVGVSVDSAVVVMSHNYSHDKTFIRQLLDSDCWYIGALGPKVRTEQLLAELREEFEVDESRLEALHYPVGLDIGASDPETIAVSVLAEIQAAASSRSGGFLKNREGRIYDR